MDEISCRTPVPGRTNSGRMKSRTSRVVSRTMSRTSGLARRRRGRTCGKPGVCMRRGGGVGRGYPTAPLLLQDELVPAGDAEAVADAVELQPDLPALAEPLGHVD